MQELRAFPVILLAAGKGSRAGGTKALVRVGDRPWLAHQLGALRAAGLAWIAVLGSDAGKIREAVPSVAEGRVVVNPHPVDSPFPSLRLGLAALEPGERGAFVLPIDTPCPALEVWGRLLAALPRGEAVALPCWDGRAGHPVLVSAAFGRRLLAVPDADPDARLDRQVRALSAVQRARVEVADPNVRRNLNTAADFAALGAGA